MPKYDRMKACSYARQWALDRNPDYYNFTGIGGDCANFASQCIYAGAGIMNYTPVLGWFYRSLNDRAPAWSSVKYLHKFLCSNSSAGPLAREANIVDILPGDIIQLSTWMEDFHHTLVATEVGNNPSLDSILVCCHTYDSLDRPLASYDIKKIRFLHIVGVNETPRGRAPGYRDNDTALRGEGEHGSAASRAVLNPSFHNK